MAESLDLENAASKRRIEHIQEKRKERLKSHLVELHGIQVYCF